MHCNSASFCISDGANTPNLREEMRLWVGIWGAVGAGRVGI